MNKPACINLLMSHAAESFEIAQGLVDNGHFGVSVSRAYYAMFYAAQAALLHLDLQFRRHSAVIAAFGKEFIKSGILAASFSKSLRNGFDLRVDCDYRLASVPKEEAASAIEKADDFLRAVREYLTEQGYELDEDTKDSCRDA